MKGRIVNVSFETQNVVYLTQGIGQEEQYKYDGKFPGGNGPMLLVVSIILLLC
mgnify:CR=1 FL=1